jgi:fibronectin type 3 domain-containing protein
MDSRLACRRRRRVTSALAAVTLGTMAALPARAEGVFVSSPNRVDIAYDDARGVLYVSNGTQLQRFELSSRTFLTPLTLGGNLKGMDISADGASLAVADGTLSGGQPCVHIIDLATLTTQSPCFAPSSGESGSFTAAYDSDGSVLVSTQNFGSGSEPLRRYVPSAGTTTTVATVTQNTMLRANADHSVIALAEANSSDGPFDSYAVASGVLTRESGFTSGTGKFNYEIAVSPDAQQYAIPTYGGTIITDANLAKLSTVIGTYAAGQPVGVAYNPINTSMYFPWAGTSQVYVYDRKTLTQTGSHNLSGTFGSNGNYAFVNGRVKTSNDGRLLFVTVDGGVRYLTVDPVAPTGLAAAPFDASVDLTWAAVPNALSYSVYRGTLPAGEALTPVAAGVTGTAVSVSGLSNGTTYYFTVAAVATSGTSTPSDEVSATPIALPAQVTGLTAVAGDGQIGVSWLATPGAAVYTVYQGTQPGGESVVATGLTNAYFSPTGVTNGTTYYFRVAAINTSGTGPISLEVSATPMARPATPTGLVATAGNGSVALHWNAAARAASYSVYAASTPGAEFGVPPISNTTGTSIDLTGLVNGRIYYFIVESVNVGGQSGPSNEVSSTPAAGGGSGGGGAMDSMSIVALIGLAAFRRRRLLLSIART